MHYINIILLNVLLSYYLLSVLQWYSYSFKRILFHFKKKRWHFYFFAFPFFIYKLTHFYEIPLGFLLFCIFVYIPIFYLWFKKLDKRLVFTARIKGFFTMLALYLALLIWILQNYHFMSIGIEPLIFSVLSSYAYEYIKMLFYAKKAREKLASIEGLTVILITASFGKTSMKNFLFQLIAQDFIPYKSPKSVNTFKGVVRDINENLPLNTDIFIVEAGARKKGDIKDITKLVAPHFVIVGEIGRSHLEYFKNNENIRAAKLEALESERLKAAFLHSSTNQDGYIYYDLALRRVDARLDGLDFTLMINGKKQSFKAPLLGSFNAQNLAACILLALHLGIKLEDIIKRVESIKAVKHRLELLSTKPKLIIDDSFNGNLSGMSASYTLCGSYKGRRVIVTPGIFEVNDNENIRLALYIDQNFDFAILTGKSNVALIAANLDIEYFILKDKKDLQKELARLTKNGDLILFSNDSPSYL